MDASLTKVDHCVIARAFSSERNLGARKMSGGIVVVRLVVEGAGAGLKSVRTGA